MVYSSSDSVGSIGLLSPVADDPAPSHSAFDGVLDAYRQQGYRAGYNRALNGALADFLLFSQQLLRRVEPEQRQRLSEALRQFERTLERSLTDRSGSADHFVEDGLGI